MRLPDVPAAPRFGELPLWPPLLATRGPGAATALHVHHAMHLMVCLDPARALRVRTDGGAWQAARGVLTAPDAAHAIDASGAEVLLVFLDPESDAGRALLAVLPGAVRLLTAAECAALAADFDPVSIMRGRGDAWTAATVTTLGGPSIAAPRTVHPKVRKLLQRLATAPLDEVSLDVLAATTGLSPGRLMHAFTESIGIPLRPYLLWLRSQRAAGAIVGGAALSDAAHAAGFADAAHMSRTFRRTFGVTPSQLRRPKIGAR